MPSGTGRGERGFAFASGLAAEHTLLHAIAKPGDHVVIPDDAYGGTYRLFAHVENPWGLDFDTAPVSDIEAVRAAIKPGKTKAVWLETPTNPLLTIGDIAELAAVAHQADALLVVDNTFASPTCSSHWLWAPMWSRTPPPSTSAGTPT